MKGNRWRITAAVNRTQSRRFARGAEVHFSPSVWTAVASAPLFDGHKPPLLRTIAPPAVRPSLLFGRDWPIALSLYGHAGKHRHDPQAVENLCPGRNPGHRAG